MAKGKLNLPEKVIAYRPDLARAFGNTGRADLATAIYLQQLCYWSDKGSRVDGFIYKTKDELQAETALSHKQQDRCREKLEKLGLLETKRIKANGVPMLHYRVNVKKANEFIEQRCGKVPEGSNGKRPKSRMEYPQKAGSINREYYIDNRQDKTSSSRDFTNVKSLSEQLSSFPALIVQEKASVLREHNEILSHQLRVGYVTDLLLGMPDAPKPNAREFVEAAGGMAPLYKFIAYMLTQLPLDFLVDWFGELKRIPWRPDADWKRYLFGAATRQYEQWRIDDEEKRYQEELKAGSALDEEMLAAAKEALIPRWNR